MNHKKIIVVGIILLGILALFMTVDYKNKNGLNGQTVSPNILYLTSPVNSLSGKVEKIEGNVVSISSQYTLPQTAPIAITVMPNQPPVMPTPQIKTITYKLLVTDKTQISQPPSNISYLFKTVPPPSALDLPIPSAPKLTVKNIKVGQYITVNSQIDLRTLLKNTFEATEINLPPITNTLSGKIVKVTNNTLILKAFAPVAVAPPIIAIDIVPPTPIEKEYTIYITQDTEISRNIYSTDIAPAEPPKPEKLAFSDLKVDMQATVYTVEDVIETQTLTALRIEPAASTSPAILP
ncbi:MAG: hypothetical protein ACD_50C00325G0002 [uncultured bacterium]|nr:MAG: hypothetical protein ACD_50C00325G0002 [uncultured bacterium]